MNSSRLILNVGLMTTSMLCAGYLLSAPAYAAEAPEAGMAPQPAAGRTADSGNDDDVIVVTAQRRAELSRDVPISIAAIGGDQLRQAGANSLSDIARMTPAVRFDYASGWAQPTIRGVGTALVVSGGGANVGIYVDGFYSPNPLAADTQLMNVQSIQVLKGPQGTLFGRNTTGGAIVITSAEPSVEPHVVAEAEYGRFNSQRYQAYATAGLGENIAFDIEGLYRKGDGFLTNLITGSDKAGAYDNWSIRTGVKVQLGGVGSLLARYTHIDIDDPTTAAAGVYADKTGRALTTALNVAGIFGDPVVATKRGEVAYADVPFSHIKSDVFQLTGKFDIGFADLTSYTQHRKDKANNISDNDATATPVFTAVIPVTDKTFTQEFILTSKPGGKLQWVAGAFYMSYIDHFTPSTATIFGATTSPFYGSYTKTTSLAGFADLTYEVSDDLFLTVGARISHDEIKDPYWEVTNGMGGLVRFNVNEVKNDRVSPRVVIRYKPSEETSVYASYTRGNKPAIINVGAGRNDGIYVSPEKIDAFEVGFKYGTARFSFDTAAYYYSYKNLQVAAYIGTQSFINNAANARIYGLEGQLTYKPVGGLEIAAGAAYTNAKYKKYDGSVYLDTSDNATPTYDNVSIDASGYRMQRTPEFTANGSIKYTMDLGGGALSLSSNFYYSSKFYFDSSNQFSQGGYGTVGLRAQWTDPSEHYTIALFGNNVTDSKYRTQALSTSIGVQSIYATPATYGVSVRVDY